MLISTERLYYEAESTGFRPEILEKVIYLIHLLNRFTEDPFLKDRFVLKGGTALNVFCFNYPRLSVDIDINYIGSAAREVMLQEKYSMESAIENIVLDEGMVPQRKPSEHAGGKWAIRYTSAIRGQGTIENDVLEASQEGLILIQIRCNKVSTLATLSNTFFHQLPLIHLISVGDNLSPTQCLAGYKFP